MHHDACSSIRDGELGELIAKERATQRTSASDEEHAATPLVPKQRTHERVVFEARKRLHGPANAARPPNERQGKARSLSDASWASKRSARTTRVLVVMAVRRRK
jgi:hypothetical protein